MCPAASTHIVLSEHMKLRCQVITCDRMDEKWFRAQKRKAGVTNAEIAALRGRDHTVITKIVTGQQRMTMEWAQTFAEALQVPIATILEKSDILDAQQARQMEEAFAEGDAEPWAGAATHDSGRRQNQTIAEALGARPGVDIWRVDGSSMALAGLLPGDFMLVDTHQADRVKAGDIVIAQVYSRGGAKTVLRRWLPPVLVSATSALGDDGVLVVDNDNVVIRGKVIASWRAA